LSSIAQSFAENDAQTSAQTTVSIKTPNDVATASRLPRDVALSSLNLVRDVHLDLLSLVPML
jgi:hypothetical protein